jgi:hypothetical protein
MVHHVPWYLALQVAVLRDESEPHFTSLAK